MSHSKILYIAHRIPYPPNKGDKIRSFNEIKHLSKTHEIHLAALVDNLGDFQYARKLKQYCKKVCLSPIKPIQNKLQSIFMLPNMKSLSVGYFYSRDLQQKINDLLKNNSYDAIICFSSQTAQYIFLSSLWSTIRSKKTRLIMDFCDLDSDKWRQYANQSNILLNIIYKIEWKLLLNYEKKINRLFDYSIFVSTKETELFKKYFPKAINTIVMPNGVDYEFFNPQGSVKDLGHNHKEENPKLLFTGAMDYHANVDGVVWFCDNIFPIIRKEFPNTVFYIVGNNPNRTVLKLGLRDGIIVTGYVSDIRSYYHKADICTIPLRLARGVQNKVLESMSMGKPIVATSIAVEGLGITDKSKLIIADNPITFAGAVCRLILNRRQCLELGQAARKFVIEKFNWEKNIQILENKLQ